MILNLLNKNKFFSTRKNILKLSEQLFFKEFSTVSTITTTTKYLFIIEIYIIRK